MLAPAGTGTVKYLRVSILTRPRWAGAPNLFARTTHNGQFQSSPARGGRVLIFGIPFSNRRGSFNPHPPEVGGCSWLCCISVRAGLVSILTRPRWAGALVCIAAASATWAFQSSPARGGRVLQAGRKLCHQVAVSILTRPRWAGAQTASLTPVTPALSFNPHPPEVGGCSLCLYVHNLTCSVSILTRPRWAGALLVFVNLIQNNQVSILTRPRWAGARERPVLHGTVKSFNPHPPEVGGCSPTHLILCPI